ncbi:MAG: OPT/YSL family transporter, partial [Candidatus Obscuribacterales bacterium]|nr:OPT/YSL family transporter [Candidatus Obscuribacterales bacterium]
QLCGVFFGTITIVPAWFLMIPNKAALEAYNPPMTILYKAVAEALSNGIGGLPETARIGIVVGAVIGLVMTIIETVYPKTKKFMPSPMGLGLSWIFPFQNSLGFCIGAVIAFIWKKINAKNAEGYTVPVASGAIAGESIACAFIAIFNAVKALLHI